MSRCLSNNKTAQKVNKSAVRVW